MEGIGSGVSITYYKTCMILTWNSTDTAYEDQRCSFIFFFFLTTCIRTLLLC